MANGFLTPFLTGAFTEYTRQEIENKKPQGLLAKPEETE